MSLLLRVDRAAMVALTAELLGGCAHRGAPSFVLFGAYFPGWMLMAGIAILVSIAARVVVSSSALNETIPWQLSVCISAGVLVAVLIWMLWFGR